MAQGLDLLSEFVPTGAKVIVATGYADPDMIERAFHDGPMITWRNSPHSLCCASRYATHRRPSASGA